MLNQDEVTRLASLLAEARKGGRRLETISEDLIPLDAGEADAVQDATAALLGVVRAYKVAQVGTAPGSWGAICEGGALSSPARLTAAGHGLKIEIEIAFRLGRDLPGRADGRPYGAEEVADAVEGASAAFELLDSRLPAIPKPPALLARADMMGNWGLVTGPLNTAWRQVPREKSHVTLDIAGKRIVDQHGGHPSADPFHPVVWLANALAARGHGLTAGQSVITGSFGGCHPILPGETAQGVVEGFAPISFTRVSEPGG